MRSWSLWRGWTTQDVTSENFPISLEVCGRYEYLFLVYYFLHTKIIMNYCYCIWGEEIGFIFLKYRVLTKGKISSTVYRFVYIWNSKLIFSHNIFCKYLFNSDKAQPSFFLILSPGVTRMWPKSWSVYYLAVPGSTLKPSAYIIYLYDLFISIISVLFLRGGGWKFPLMQLFLVCSN